MKKKLLVWSDSVTAGTGFGVVSKHVLKALNKIFDIDQLAINYSGEFVDSKEFPYQIVPARLNDPRDPYGNKMFLQSLASGKYDYIWVMNDTFVVEETAKKISGVLQQLRTLGKKTPVIVYYYPVDCQVLHTAKTMLQVADHIVAYCQFGVDQTLLKVPEVGNKMSVINHGVDTKDFYPLKSDDRKAFRKKLLNVDSDETFVWMQINRNSARKDIARTILAFKEFKEKIYDNSILYLHTAPRDTTIDLFAAVEDVGLSPVKDVIFPRNYSPQKPFPVGILNYFYNAGDAFITTTLGEGWGLTHLEAASAGLPLVCPNNTCFPEQLANGNRGYLYDCKEKIWIDNSGYRPYANLTDIVSVMKDCYQDVKNNSPELQQKKDLMAGYISKIQWEDIGSQWLYLFKKIDSGEIKTEPSKGSLGEVL